LHRKEWLVQGVLLAAELVLYWRGIFDANHVLRFALCLVAYNVIRHGPPFIKLSDKMKETLMAISVAGLVIWLTRPSRTTIIWIIAWTAILLLRRHTRQG
jgi:hypothetical protein